MTYEQECQEASNRVRRALRLRAAQKAVEDARDNNPYFFDGTQIATYLAVRATIENEVSAWTHKC